MRIIFWDIKKDRHVLRGEYSLFLIAGMISFFLFSCSSPKRITYFKDVPDTLKTKVVAQSAYYTPTIQPDDILQVTVQTLDAGTTSLMNQQNTPSWPITGNSSGSNPVSSVGAIDGYLVDKNGYVSLPLLGKVLVKGKTTDQIRDEIGTKAAQFYKDPVVNVRFANFRITVLGEVTRPSTYIMPNEKVTLLDAIGAAGDLTIFGKRENVMVIREANGKKEFGRFDLTKSEMFSSPFFYLQPGDVVYVEPNKSKVSSTDIAAAKRLTILAPIVSLLIVLATRLKF